MKHDEKNAAAAPEVTPELSSPEQTFGSFLLEDKPLQDERGGLPPLSPPAVPVDLYERPTPVAVHVFSYPFYISSPLSTADGRTLYKVTTQAEPDVALGVHPGESFAEEVVLLRTFPAASPEEALAIFRNILTAARHQHQDSRGEGCWFLTSLELIDAIAAAVLPEASA
jgi:hypothetical protein